MQKHRRLCLTVALVAALGAATFAGAQPQSGLTAEQRQKRIDTENELEKLAVIERKVMMPMADGVRLATDIYIPKTAGPSNRVPVVFVRTPAPESAPAGLSTAAPALQLWFHEGKTTYDSLKTRIDQALAPPSEPAP